MKKQKAKTRVSDVVENAREMVNKRQGPWTRPPPAAQQVTSKCMTCGLLMRYPADVESFRCTICMAINDLVPLKEKASQRAAKLEEVLKAKGNNLKGVESRVPHLKTLSVSFTQHIIEDCLRKFMVARFCTDHVPRTTARSTTGTSQYHDHFQGQENHQSPPYSKGESASSKGNFPEYEPKYHFSAEPTLQRGMHKMDISAKKSSREKSAAGDAEFSRTPISTERRKTYHKDREDRVFLPLLDYITQCFSSPETLNQSFLTEKPHKSTQTGRRSSARASRATKPTSEDTLVSETEICDVEPKLLMLGDVAKNGSWWLGGQNKKQAQPAADLKESAQSSFSQPEKTPSLNFVEIGQWYATVESAAENWDTTLAEVRSRPDWASPTVEEIEQACRLAVRGARLIGNRLMKCCENLLTRVGGRITQPEELRFILLILENPRLSGEPTENNSDDLESLQGWPCDIGRQIPAQPPSRMQGPIGGRHSVILKRIVGLIANCPIELHHHLVSWFTHYDHARFVRTKDVVSGFLTYRLMRQNTTETLPGNFENDLLPALVPGGNIGSLHDQLKLKKKKKETSINPYSSDWQARSAAKMLAILFEANFPRTTRHALAPSSASWKPSLAQGIFLPMSDFYVSMVDILDLVADFEEFSKKGSKFAFCQYPFLMSVWAKTQVLDYDSKRQQKETARDAFFDNLLRHTQTQQNLTLDVRRDCLADDSLKSIAETMGSVSNESKKALRIKFRGEEGIDGGGLRKEWFLLLVREVFNPDLGLFEFDEDSQYCYFNPHTLDGGDQFYLVGVILGLAIYNSTILDVPLPPFVFRKLASMSPTTTHTNGLTQVPQHMRYTLSDLAEYRPRLARGLKDLLDFDGDVESTFMRNFVADVERYGSRCEVPLCKGGEKSPVTNKNRRDYVDLYIRYMLDTSVARQFEPFKRGFYQVCSGSAFGLFRPEEVELLVRGSDEPLDVTTLRGVAEYEEWGIRGPDGTIDQIEWFWELFIDAVPQDQRKLLLFITGSDRVPAAGASMMPLRISCLGDDSDRLPVARTCFNKISLWRYASKGKMGRLLWLAVHESEGFGLQ